MTSFTVTNVPLSVPGTMDTNSASIGGGGGTSWATPCVSSGISLPTLYTGGGGGGGIMDINSGYIFLHNAMQNHAPVVPVNNEAALLREQVAILEKSLAQAALEATALRNKFNELSNTSSTTPAPTAQKAFPARALHPNNKFQKIGFVIPD